MPNPSAARAKTKARDEKLDRIIHAVSHRDHDVPLPAATIETCEELSEFLQAIADVNQVEANKAQQAALREQQIARAKKNKAELSNIVSAIANTAKNVQRALDEISAAITKFKQHHPDEEEVTPENDDNTETERDIDIENVGRPAAKRRRRNSTGQYEAKGVPVVSLLYDDDNVGNDGNGNINDDGDEIEIVTHVRVAAGRESSAYICRDIGVELKDGEASVVAERRGVRALEDYPHPRPLCAVHPFDDINDNEAALKFCRNCFCVRCQKKAAYCTNWAAHGRLRVRQVQSVD